MSRSESRRRPSFDGLEGRALLSTLVESEPNDRREVADRAALDPSGPLTIRGRLGGRDDRDFIRLTAPVAGELQVRVISSDRVRAKVQIEDGRGRELAETEPNDGMNRESLSVRAGQVVFVRVRSARKAVGAYAVRLTLSGRPSGGGDESPGGGDEGGPGATFVERESNDRKESATRVVLDGSGRAELRGTSRGRDDKDFFTLTAPASGVMRVTIVDAEGGSVSVEVEDSADDELLEIEPERSDGGTFAVRAGQRLFVRVRSRDRAVVGYRVFLALAN